MKSGETLVSVREDASDSSKLLAVVDKVSDRLRRGIGESLWTVRASAPLEQVTTSSLQALRLYSQAIRVGDQEGDTHRAVEILRQAVTFDTSFAMAYRKLGVYLRDMGAHAASDDALARAFRNRNRLPELERYNTAGSYYASVALPDSAIATYRALLALYPTDMRGLNNLASVYMDLREYARAESLYHRAIESDSTVALLFNHLATVQLNGGRLRRGRSHARRARAALSAAQEAETIAATLSIMRGDFDGATVRTHRMLVDAGTDAGQQARAAQDAGDAGAHSRATRGVGSRLRIGGGAAGRAREAAVAISRLRWRSRSATSGIATTVRAGSRCSMRRSRAIRSNRWSRSIATTRRSRTSTRWVVVPRARASCSRTCARMSACRARRAAGSDFATKARICARSARRRSRRESRRKRW